MPRRERTAPPSPWPPVEQIPPDDFHLASGQRAELLGLLPPRLSELAAPPEYQAVGCRSIADVIVQACEEWVRCHNTIAHQRPKRAVPSNPANVARAINDLAVALRPFVSGAIDVETMDTIGAALGMPPEEARDTGAVMARLARFQHALAGRKKTVRALRVRDEAHRDLKLLCGRIGVTLRALCEANSAPMSDAKQAHFLDRLLILAGIPHPDAPDNLKRLIVLLHS